MNATKIITNRFIIILYPIGHIFQHPVSTKADIDEWANFTCTIDCSELEHHSLRWRFALSSDEDVERPYIPSKRFRSFGRKNNITIESLNARKDTSCRTAGTEMTETIRILVTDGVIGTVVQCAAVDTRGDRNYFSKFAVLY